jgi:hypothetical protein
MKTIVILWRFSDQEELCNLDLMAQVPRLSQVKLAEMTISFLKEDNNLLKKLKIKIDPNHLLPNLWKVQEVEGRKVKIRMRKNQYLKWIQSVCLVQANLQVVYYNALN